MKFDVWRFREPLGPPLRRALFAGIPVGGSFLLDLGLSAGELAAVGIGTLLAGFVAFDSPSGLTRAAWQTATAPVTAATGALGALTSGDPVLAVAAMFAVAAAAGLAFAVSLRVYVAALNVTLALLLAQGLASPADAPEVFLLGGVGVLVQATFSLAAALVDRVRERLDPKAGLRVARERVEASLSFDAVAFRHGLRFALALGAGVAVYEAIDLGPHGYWVPLTVLFVLRPTAAETWERIAMRAAGTVLGLLIATPVAEVIGGVDALEAVAIGVAAAFSWALLAIEYALFTAAITCFAVIDAHAFGQPALAAADERAVGTVIGLAIVAVAFTAFRERPSGGRAEVAPVGGA